VFFGWLVLLSGDEHIEIADTEKAVEYYKKIILKFLV